MINCIFATHACNMHLASLNMPSPLVLILLEQKRFVVIFFCFRFVCETYESGGANHFFKKKFFVLRYACEHPTQALMTINRFQRNRI